MGHVLVVGGGMVGLSTAWFLRERGEDVTVVDAARAGMGASSTCLPLTDRKGS